jgi:hypothetical protein
MAGGAAARNGQADAVSSRIKGGRFLTNQKRIVIA